MVEVRTVARRDPVTLICEGKEYATETTYIEVSDVRQTILGTVDFGYTIMLGSRMVSSYMS